MVAESVPAGLGEPVFDRLDADLAHALMSINAVKGVEIGDGFAVVTRRGSETAMRLLRRVSRATTPGDFRRHQQRTAYCGASGAETHLQHYGAGANH